MAIPHVTKSGGSIIKDVPTNAGDAGSSPVPGRSSRKGHGSHREEKKSFLLL